MRKGLLLTLLFVTSLSFAQESILKEFAEPRRNVKFCLYPSTLRMINIKKDPEFFELVNDIDKLLIYTLDSATVASNEGNSWIEEYKSRGYEEYIYMSGPVDLIILGKEEEFVGLSGTEDQLAAFYLKGNIAFQKIPKLIQTFEGGDMLSIVTDQFGR